MSKLLTPDRSERLNLSRRRALKGLAGATLMGMTHKSLGSILHGGAASSTGVDPLTLPLVSDPSTLFTYQGSYTMPGSFQYGGGGASIAGVAGGGSLGTIYVSGETSGNAQIGSATLPSLAQIQGGGASATLITAPTNIGVDVGQSRSSSHSTLAGSLIYNNAVYMAFAVFYNTGGQTAVLSTGNTSLSSFGPACVATGDAGAAGYSQSNFGGQMGILPAIWRPIFGGPAFVTAGAGTSFFLSNCCGFGFATFDPAAVLMSGADVPLKVWQNYPGGTSSFTGVKASPNFNTTALCGRQNVTGTISGTTLTIASQVVSGSTYGVGSVVKASGYSGVILSGSAGVYTLDTSGSVSSSGSPNIYVGNNVQNICYGAPTGGDDLVSEYDGPLCLAIIPNGTRTLLFISVHHQTYDDGGAPEQRWSGTVSANSGATAFTFTTTSSNALMVGEPMYDSGTYGQGNFIGQVATISGSSGTFVSGATETYSGVATAGNCLQACGAGGSGTCDPRVLQITEYDLAAIYNSYQAHGPNGLVLPYRISQFPNWETLFTTGCLGNYDSGAYCGCFAYDPVNQLMHGNPVGLAGSGQHIEYVWSVNAN